jgi:hypothetical protein
MLVKVFSRKLNSSYFAAPKYIGAAFSKPPFTFCDLTVPDKLRIFRFKFLTPLLSYWMLAVDDILLIAS